MCIDENVNSKIYLNKLVGVSSIDLVGQNLKSKGLTIRYFTDNGKRLEDELHLECSQEDFEKLFNTKLEREDDHSWQLVK